MICLRANEMELKFNSEMTHTTTSRHGERRKKIIISNPTSTRAIEPTLFTFQRCLIAATTGMRHAISTWTWTFAKTSERMITNYFDISFLPQQHSPVCSFMAFLDRLHGVNEMLLISSLNKWILWVRRAGCCSLPTEITWIFLSSDRHKLEIAIILNLAQFSTLKTFSNFVN